MSDQRPTRTWSKKDIDKMLELLDIMETPGFDIVLPDPTPEDIEAGLAKKPWGWPTYHPIFEEFWHLCYKTSCFIAPYDPLPEDETQDGIRFCVMGASFAPEAFDSATVNQVRRYLILCTRGERFADGHILGEFRRGSLTAALRRLKALRSQMK